ncbi:MAG: hypothetical protein ABI337_01595 [Nitrososphaera sp.]
MDSLQQLIARQKQKIAQREQSQQYYNGPTMYRGHQILWKHSLTRVVKTLRRSLYRSQFASLNIVGIPGSGKTVLATNIITDLIEAEEKETKEVWHVHWKGADDLRSLGELLENLEKFQNHIVVFDDVSKALDKLSSAEQAEIFEQLTTTRHITGGRLLVISLYHYTYANLKSVKSQGVVIIYTSCTLTEYQNIQQMLPTKRAQMALRKFAKIYEHAFMKGEFSLKIHEDGEPVRFIDSNPFRPCFVINLFKAHLALFMKLESGFHPPAVQKEKIDSAVYVQKVKKNWRRYGLLALKLICMQKGYTEAVDPDFVRAYKFTIDEIKRYSFNWAEIASLLRSPNAKRVYRQRKKEKQIADEIITESRAKVEQKIELPDVPDADEDLDENLDENLDEDDI